MPSSTWMDDLADMLKTMEPADVASMFAGARGSVPIYSALYSKDASGPDELAFEARNRAISTEQRDAAAHAAMQQQALQRIPEEALRKAVAARMREEAQYPPALATRRADFAPQPRYEMRATPAAPVQQRRPFDKGGVVRSVIAGAAKGAKTVAKTPAAARQISRDLMPSSLSIEKLAEALGVNVKEAPNVLSQRESTKNLRKFIGPSAVQHRVYHGSNVPEGIVDDAQFAHYEPDSSDIHWLATDPDFADQYTAKYMEYPGEQGAIFPAHIQLRNPLEVPFDMNKRITPEVWKFAEDLGFSKSDFKEWLLENDMEKPKQAWRIIDSPQFRDAAMERGYDGIRALEAGSETFGVFDRNKIKSQFNEGTYDTRTPDIGKKEGGTVEMRPFAGGGGVRKTLQQMADELLLKGVKTADKPDLARRSLFGLRPQPALDLPLARMDDIKKDVTKDLAKAPTVSEKSVEVNPTTGSVKSTLQSVANAPMSRRAVLQTAAGQVLRGALPGVGDALPTPDILGEIAKVVDVAKPVQAAAPAFTNPIAIIMHMRKSGATEEEIGKALGLTNPAELGPALKSSAMPKSQEEIDAAKDFLFRNPEARAALEKASDGDIIKFAQLAQNKPHSLPPDWLLERFLRNGELEERMRTWLNTKGEYAALEKEVPKDFALPVDRNRAMHEWQNFQTQYENVAEPAEYLRGAPPLLKTPSRALQEITGLGTDTDAPLMSVRGELRQLRDADPEQYEAMKSAARDVSMDSAEKAIQLGLPKSKVQKVLSGQMTTDDLPRWYMNHREFDAPERDLFRLFNKGFNKGGGVRKTLQEMTDSLLLRGVRTADKPDLARRSLFGLKAQPALDLPLARIDDIEKSLTKDAGRDLAKAPAITEKTVTVDPGRGAAKSTLQSISETPMSRRSVLSAAAGQVLRHALPGVGNELPGVGDVAKIVESVATPGLAATKANIPGLVAMAMKQGMNADEAVEFVSSQFRQPPRFGGMMARGEDPAEYLAQHIEDLHGRFEEPFINFNPEFTGAVRPGKAFQEMIGREDERIKPLALKPVMRGLKQADPDKFRELIQAAKDRSMASVENLLTYPEVDPDVVQRYMRGELRSLPSSYRDKLGYDE